MNIDKYVYGSGLIAQGCWDKFDDYDKKALEKFAELLVLDCCKVLEDNTVKNEYGGYYRIGLPEHIKHHFGME